MKKIILFFTAVFFLSFSSIAQLNKKTWLVGGSGSFNSKNNNYQANVGSSEATITEINLTPNIGYFIIDKFSVGIKSTFSWEKVKGLSAGAGSGTALRFDYGPFVRYYFLEKEKPLNIVTDLSYQFGNVNLTGEKGSRSNFSVMAGPALYFNSSVGIEFLFGYKYYSEKISSLSFGNPYKLIEKGLQFGIGFQIHLEKL